MASTPTTQIPLAFNAPHFTLPDMISGKELTINDIKGDKGTVVMFICNHCPYVIHVLDEIVRLGNEYVDRGFGFVAISSNDVEKYPADGPNKMKELARLKEFPFPYLYDETQDVARAYDAVCTPDFSVFDQDLKCVYRGQLDNSRPHNNEPNDGKDLRNVLESIIAEKTVSKDQKPSIGCSIKWKN